MYQSVLQRKEIIMNMNLGIRKMVVGGVAALAVAGGALTAYNKTSEGEKSLSKNEAQIEKIMKTIEQEVETVPINRKKCKEYWDNYDCNKVFQNYFDSLNSTNRGIINIRKEAQSENI